MQSELHGNVVHHGVEVLLFVSMLFLLAIPKSLINSRAWNLNTLVCTAFAYPNDFGNVHQINTCADYYPFLKVDKDCAEH